MEINNENKYRCLCCGYYTLVEKTENSFQVCPVCYWEDDGVQFKDPTYKGGANRISLAEAKNNFEKFGAIEERYKDQVRLPHKEEMK